MGLKAQNRQVGMSEMIITAKAIEGTLLEISAVADKLKQFIKANNLSVMIAGKPYAQVEAWQFAGGLFGVSAIPTDTKEIAPIDLDTKEIKYSAFVELRDTEGNVVGAGYAMCSTNEKKKKDFDEYAIASMAQTRAIGKAYRNKYAWIMRMAGYEATPMEEIDRDSMELDLKNAKARLFKAFKEASVTGSEAMLEAITKATGKDTIETLDDAETVIKSLQEAE